MRSLTIIESNQVSGSISAGVAATTAIAGLVGGMLGAAATSELGSYFTYIGTPVITVGFTFMCPFGSAPIMLMCGAGGMILGSTLSSSAAPAIGFLTAGPASAYLAYSLATG